jgi:predicted transposase YdaD
LVRKGEVIGEKRGKVIGRKEGEVIGEKRGEMIGRINSRIETIKNMISKGKTSEEISDWCGYDLDFVREVVEGKLPNIIDRLKVD